MEQADRVGHLKLKEHLHGARHEIFSEWLDLLRLKLDGAVDAKIAWIQKNRKKKRDLFTTLLESLKHGEHIVGQNIRALQEKIDSRDYSVFDYHIEVSILDQCLEQRLRSVGGWTDGQKLEAIIAVHKQLNLITMQVIKSGPEVIEHIAETSRTAFCRTDEKGHIVSANLEMERLTGERTVVGSELVKYFAHDDKTLVTSTIFNMDEDVSNIMRLNLNSVVKGKRVPVCAEIGAVVIDGRYRGGYAHFIDISFADQQDKQLFNRALLGIVKLNCKGDLLFANKSMLQILNLNDYNGVNIFDLLPDAESKALVKKNIENRIDGKSDEYSLELVRSIDNTRIPVVVSAFPERDFRGDKVIGSFAIIRCRIADRMHEHIENHHDEVTLLKHISKELSPIVPYDRFTVAKYSDDCSYACPMFSREAGGEHPWQRRWWKMTAAQIQWASQKEILLVEDLEEFFNQEEWKDKRHEPDIEELLAEGFKCFVYYPIFRDKRLVASVSLLNKEEGSLKAYHKKQLKSLPIEQAVHTALYYYNHRVDSFTSNLISDLAYAGSNIGLIAKLIAQSVAKHYSWYSVALFKVNSKKKVIQLIAQAVQEDRYQLTTDYEQRIDIGVLGWVCQHNTVENISNIKKDERFKDIYINAIVTKEMNSELCIPIRFGGAFWLLNIEDEQIGAFSEQEQKEICGVMERVREYLENTWLSRFLEASLESATDAVFVTDSDDQVIQVNPMATGMLAIPVSVEETAAAGHENGGPICALKHITPVPLSSLFANPSEAAGKITASYATATMINLKRRNGGIIPVVMTGVDLREDFGYSIHMAADMTAQQRLKEINNLKKIYYEIAIQTKTPLSLIIGWIKRIKKFSPTHGIKNNLDKILRQLKKLEITYNRLALYSVEKKALPFAPTLIDMSEVMEAIQNDLPINELDRVDWQYEKGLHYLNGDIFQLKFCFETIMSHLLRFVPEDNVIKVSVKSSGENLISDIVGWHPKNFQRLAESPDQKDDVAKAIADMALGEQLVDQFIQNHNGNYTAVTHGRQGNIQV